jgi:RNA polymerase sigma-70 factor (ECF subfamily)
MLEVVGPRQTQTGDGVPNTASGLAGNGSVVADPKRKEANPIEDLLLDVSRQGDIHAFGLLIEPYYAACLKRAATMLRNRGDAEDEVQNALYKAFHRLKQYRGEGPFGAWLSRIVENQCLMRLREMRQCQFIYLDEPTDNKLKLELVGQAETPEDRLGTEQVKTLVRREISRMPPLLRNVMLLRDVQQLPMSVVAGRLGLTVPAAKSRLMRARAELRLRLAKHCGPKGGATLIDGSTFEKLGYARAG